MEIKRGVFAENPFPGLRPFWEEEGYLFFGRESQIDLMVDKLAKRHLLTVVGTSGSGKSSLVNCGLRPALQRGLMAAAGIRWRMVQFRPGNHPLRAMARALGKDDAIRSKFDFDPATLQELVEASLRMSKGGLSEVYKRAQFVEGTNLLIVVDQFEELFRYRDVDSSATGSVKRRSQEATAFVNLLLDAKTQATYPIYIVLTMRSDFLGECAEFTGLPEAINDGQYLVPRLTRDERRAAIAGPVGVAGARISPLLLTQLVNDVGDNPDQLSILQHAMNRTWARWRQEGRNGELDLDDYEAIGTMSHALNQHAEKAYRELGDPRQQTICEKIFKALTDKRTDPGIRRPTAFSTICELAEESLEEVKPIIDVFRKPSRSFLMPPLPEALEADTVVDISHESLMRLWERLKQWTDEEVQSAQLYRRLSETAAWHAAGRAALWDDPDLQFALDWKNKERPTKHWAELYGGGFEEAMSFLAASEKQRDKELQEKEGLRQRELLQAQALAEERQRRIEQQTHAARRLRRWLGAVGALAGVAVLLLFVAVYALREEAKANRAVASARAALTSARAELTEKTADLQKITYEIALAQGRLETAWKETEEARLEALRVRNMNLESLSNNIALANSLLQYSDSQQSALWLNLKGSALVELGDYEGAMPLFTLALERVPDAVNARTSRGYVLLLLNQPAYALKDFEYVRDHIDPRSAMNNLYLTLAQVRLGEYSAAKVSLTKAIENTPFMKVGIARGGVIPPEITQATGRVSLQADKNTFEAALYYMQANLEAYAGNKDTFQAALYRADKKAEPLSSVSQKDAYFMAMTWAWLSIGNRCLSPDVRCDDYGAFASEGALWERAGYKIWASCYYQKFEKSYEHWRDAKYASLNTLVEEQRRRLDLPPTNSCPTLPERDALTLETEAKEAFARNKFQEAATLFDQALGRAAESDKVRLLLGKAAALDQIAGAAAKARPNKDKAKATYSELKNECSQILKKSPNETKAYVYRARAQYYLDILDNSDPYVDKKIIDDIHRALVVNPTDIDALALLDDLTPDERPGDDIYYLRSNSVALARYYKLSPFSSRAFLHQAKLAQADKQYNIALKFIETAILMEPEEISFYDLRQKIEIGLGLPNAVVRQNLLYGYLQAFFVMKRRGNVEDSNRLIEINKKINTELAQSRPSE